MIICIVYFILKYFFIIGNHSNFFIYYYLRRFVWLRGSGPDMNDQEGSIDNFTTQPSTTAAATTKDENIVVRSEEKSFPTNNISGVTVVDEGNSIRTLQDDNDDKLTTELSSSSSIIEQSGVLVVDVEKSRDEVEPHSHTTDDCNDDGVVHPSNVFVSAKQFEAESLVAEYIIKVHDDPKGGHVMLKCAGTTFKIQSFHFKGFNTSVDLYNDPSASSKRLEYVDFTRRRDDKLLYMWDSRQAIAISLLTDGNKFKKRVFIAMTNLFMPSNASGDILENYVLLDLLFRMDASKEIDAVVGIRQTGEVILWKKSLEHLRFCFCDLQRPISGGETYWRDQLHAFYLSKGLFYVPEQMIPRDLDAPRQRFAITKENITHYAQPYDCPIKLQENFDKWYLLPGRFKSEEENNQDLISTLNRNKNLMGKVASKKQSTQSKDNAIDEKNKATTALRNATRAKNKKKKEEEMIAAAVAKVKAAEASSQAKPPVEATKKTRGKTAEPLSRPSDAELERLSSWKTARGNNSEDFQHNSFPMRGVGLPGRITTSSSSSNTEPFRPVVDTLLNEIKIREESMNYNHAAEMQSKIDMYVYIAICYTHFNVLTYAYMKTLSRSFWR